MITAIVLAAGNGSRMNSSTKKQYMMLLDKPLVYYSLKVFEEHKDIDNIVIVTGEEDIKYMKDNIVDKYDISKVSKIVAGGKERYNSVYNGLKASNESDYVLIHDGARPCVTEIGVSDIVRCVKQEGACVAGVPVKDTIKRIEDGNNIVETPNRNELWIAQTPQAFNYKLIVKSYDEMMSIEDETITDDSMVVEKYGGVNVKMVEFSYDNIKVTTPEDLVIAGLFLSER